MADPRQPPESGRTVDAGEDLAAEQTERSVTGTAAGQPAIQPAAAKPAAQTHDTLSDRPDLLEFDLAVAVIYHRSREAWFNGLHRGVMFLTILLGAGTVANLAPVATGIATAFFGALDLAFDLTGQATKHADLRQAHLALVRKLADAEFSPEACIKARRKMLRLGEREPPVYVNAELVARNQAILSLGRDRSHMEPISPWKRLTRHLLRGDGV